MFEEQTISGQVLSLGRVLASREPFLVVDGADVGWSAVAKLGSVGMRDISPGDPVVFVARPDLATLSLALTAISSGRTIVPLHPKKSSAEHEAIRRRVEFQKRDIALDTAAILATSGTTAEPKLVELPRRSFIASAEASRANIPLGEGDRWLLAMPFAHAGGLSILTRCLLAGATVVVHEAFDPGAVLRAIARDRISIVSVVPTMLARLLNEAGAEALQLLRAILVGGAACPPALLRECVRRGFPAITTYGLTEACSQVSVQSLAQPELRTQRDSGLPLPGTSVSIVESIRDEQGSSGRIMIRSATLMRGYLGLPPLGEAFVTEDVGRIDSLGRLLVLGRADDMIISGGENVHPAVVEQKLNAVDGVRAALVARVPDLAWGDVVGAMVVLDPRATLRDVESRAKRHLASNEVPRVWLKVEQLPEGAMGKPNRRAASEALRRHRGDSD